MCLTSDFLQPLTPGAWLFSHLPVPEHVFFLFPLLALLQVMMVVRASSNQLIFLGEHVLAFVRSAARNCMRGAAVQKRAGDTFVLLVFLPAPLHFSFSYFVSKQLGFFRKSYHYGSLQA